MAKQEKLFQMLSELKKSHFTGFVKINYSQGGITKVEKTEEVLNQIPTEK